ncbi:glutaminase [Aspergillus affinis]|uniref:glutaminase n=1 Tax=Aspergillus affinis TaxID=1070780 RepID=UPI0022FEB78F|nr:beta-lactamase/transpeptidase-like protein [Aspergillus affinis]KAI9043757.1 beta-lactamase/transpeptidase-like protein [Aspergillus affinis]
MSSPIDSYLTSALNDARKDNSGELASYIDVLATADDSKLAAALATVDGNLYSVGDVNHEFSIQSISKAFVYALAIKDANLSHVLSKIGVEPSGDSFNKLSLQPGTNRPMNPMINAGAIAAHTLVSGNSMEKRVDRILGELSRLAGRELQVDEEVYQAELKDANRNMAIGYMLKAAGIISCDPQEAVSGYIRQCSIKVNVRDLAMMAATLANRGIRPDTKEEIMPYESARQVLSVMTTCGMYDATGDWISRVGIPAKSGVSGGIIGTLPGQVGIAVFSPRLDHRGNSVRGLRIFEYLSSTMDLHMMDIIQVARASLHTSKVNSEGGAMQDVRIFSLRSAVRFVGSERLTRAIMSELNPSPVVPGFGQHTNACAIILSFQDAYSLNAIAHQIISDNIRLLLENKKNFVVIDPGKVLKIEGNPAFISKSPVVVESQDEAFGKIWGESHKVVAGH